MAVRIEPEANVVGLFRRIMRTNNLRTIKDIRPGLEQISVPGFGEFYCDDCDHHWVSRFSWITVDLKDKRICKRWLMKCQNCLKAYKPYFTVEEIERMIKEAVDICNGIRPVKVNRGFRPYKARSPHQPKLCEKCDWGATKCWLYINRYPQT